MSAARPPPHPGVDDVEDEPLAVDPSNVAASLGVGIIQTIVFIYDFVTYPLYYCMQTPWKQVRVL